MINCSGIITSAGFETPAEALFLGKKLLAIPIKGQYEQLCNAAALEKMGVACINEIDKNFISVFNKWINDSKEINYSINYSTEAAVSFLMHSTSKRNKYELDGLYPELTFN